MLTYIWPISCVTVMPRARPLSSLMPHAFSGSQADATNASPMRLQSVTLSEQRSCLKQPNGRLVSNIFSEINSSRLRTSSKAQRYRDVVDFFYLLD